MQWKEMDSLSFWIYCERLYIKILWIEVIGERGYEIMMNKSAFPYPS